MRSRSYRGMIFVCRLLNRCCLFLPRHRRRLSPRSIGSTGLFGAVGIQLPLVG